MDATSIRFLPASIACLIMALIAGCKNESSNREQTKSPAPNEVTTAPVLLPVEFTSKVLATDLATPAGIAVQPESDDVFVSTTDGVVRLDADDDFQKSTAINGFATDQYGNGPSYSFGPLGLAFLNSKNLLVGGGGQKDGDDVVRLFEIPPIPVNSPLNESESKRTFGPIGASNQSIRGEGNFFGLCVHDGKAYVTSHGDDSKGWVSLVDFADPAATGIEPVIASKALTFVDAPSAVLVLPTGKLLVAQTGELHENPDSILSIYNLEDYRLEQTIRTNLYDITSMVFDPESGNLFVTDFAWAVPDEGGLFVVDIQGGGASAKCASIVHPAALARLSTGDLIVASIGFQDGNSQPVGQILRLTAN